MMKMTPFRAFLVLFFVYFPGIVASFQLIHVFSIWRHGDRAPVRLFSSPEAAAHSLFKNGLGNLTDQGIRHAHKMGEFWRKRYVENGFISSPEQIHVRSTSHVRTQRTAKEAFSALFPNENFELEVYPIDWMLKPSLMDCPVVHALQEAKCAGYVRFPSDYAKNFDSYEYDLWRCLGLDKQVKYFGSDKLSFRLMESVLNEALNNYLFIGTNITDAHVEEARSMYRKVQRITLGIDLYHEPDILRVYSGELLNDIITKMRSKIACRQGKTCDSIVFNGYSSQDLQIFPFLEILRSTKAAVGDDAPLYTSGIFVELYANGKDYFLKAFFRRDHTDFLVDLTPNLPGFQGESCEFESFVSAVRNYSQKSNEKACQDLEKIEGRLKEIEKWGTRNGVVLIDQIEKSEAQSIENSSFILKSQNFLLSLILIILCFVIKN